MFFQRTSTTGLNETSRTATHFALLLALVAFPLTLSAQGGGDRRSVSPACTLYASPNGNDQNSGTTTANPKTAFGAASLAKPGSVVCLLAGTYYLNSSFEPPQSGSPSAWIVFRDYGDGPVNLVWTGPADAEAMIKMKGGQFPSNPAYLEFRGLNLDGRGNALDGFYCEGSHHLRFIGNSVTSTGGAGIASVTCDYLTADHNVIFHNGYIPSKAGKNAQYYSWTSGISFNSNQWFDRYSGFHNIIANNIIAGEVDQSPRHTDGNGIILDLSNRTYDYNSANTPPALIINNVVYGNGGRCIEAYTVTNFWIVNNTCYKNGLDSAAGAVGSITTNNARHGYIVNNLAVSPRSASPSFDQQNSNEDIHYQRNLYFGSSNSLKQDDNLKEAHSSRFIDADPLFVNPPAFDFSSERQYENAAAPSLLGNAFMLRSSSPALGKGIDPSTIPNLPPAIVRDLRKYVYADIAGRVRPRGGGSDLGAYQH